MRANELLDEQRMAELDRRDDELLDQRRFGPPSTEVADNVKLVPSLDENGIVTGYRFTDDDDHEIEIVIIYGGQ